MLRRLSTLSIEAQDAFYLEALSKLDESTERGQQLRTLLAMLYCYNKGVTEIHLKRICAAYKTPTQILDALLKRGVEVSRIKGRYRLSAFEDGEKSQMVFKTTYLGGGNVQQMAR